MHRRRSTADLAHSRAYLRRLLKGHIQLWDSADLDTSFEHFEKSSPQPEIKVHLEFCFNLPRDLLDFQSFTENQFLSVLLLILYCCFYHVWLKTVWIVSL